MSKDKTLLISCNFEPVAQWKLISDQNILCVQPLRFGGKYFLTNHGQYSHQSLNQQATTDRKCHLIRWGGGGGEGGPAKRGILRFPGGMMSLDHFCTLSDNIS